MEQFTDYIYNFIVNNAPEVAMYIGLIYMALIVARPLIFILVKLTKTLVDDKWAEKLYYYMDKFGFAFRKFETYARKRKNIK